MEPNNPKKPSYSWWCFDDKFAFSPGTLELNEQVGCLFTNQIKPDPKKHNKHKALSIFDIKPNTIEHFPQIERILTEIDRRTRISSDKLTSPPYSHIARLKLQFGKSKYTGSGVFVGPRHVLTAKHNVFESNYGGWAQEIRVIPCQGNNKAPYGDAYACYAYKFDEFDLALIVLDMALGEEVGWFGIMCYTEMNRLQTIKLNITGYPVIEDQSNRMFTHQGELKTCRMDDLGYDIDTSPGQSGSPVWIEKNKQCFVVGIHTHGGLEGEIVNHGIPLTEDRLRVVIDLIEKTYCISGAEVKNISFCLCLLFKRVI